VLTRIIKLLYQTMNSPALLPQWSAILVILIIKNKYQN